MTYDVIGCGEGISGLFVCALLANRGFRCLWVDTSENPGGSSRHEIPLILTQPFFKGILEPSCNALDPNLIRSCAPDAGLRLRFIGSSRDISSDTAKNPSDHAKAIRCHERYLALLKKSLRKPRVLLHEIRSEFIEPSIWEYAVGTALSTPFAGRLALIKAYASILGMYALEYGRIRKSLISYLLRRGGEYREDCSAGLTAEGNDMLGLKIGDTVCRGHIYLTENIPEERPYSGFSLYGLCRVQPGTLTHDLGDILAIPPPEDLRHTIVVRFDRNPDNPRISIQTRIHLEPGLASYTEIVSWASGMITKHLTRIMPFLSGPLQTFEVVNPLSHDTIRPWFRFSDNIQPPSLFRWKRYIIPYKNLVVCDSDMYACLGGEGELFWGLCAANVVLKQWGRSDLFTV